MTLLSFPNPLRWKLIRRGGIFLACSLGLLALVDNWLPYALLSHHNVAVNLALRPSNERLQVMASDGTITEGWLIPAPATPLEVLPRGEGDEQAIEKALEVAIAQAPPHLTLILLHGLGGSRQDVLDFGLALQQDAAAQGIPLSLAAMDLRSHGESGGPFFTYGYHEGQDILALLDVLEAQQHGVDSATHPQDANTSNNLNHSSAGRSSAARSTYAVLGVSAGGAVATAAAAQDDRLQALITLGTFADLRTTAEAQTQILPDVWRDRMFRRAEAIAEFDLAEAAPAYQMAQVTVPVFIAHGRNDGYIPFANAEQLYAAARSPKQLYPIDADHADMIPSGGDALRQEIIQFLKEASQP